MGDTELHWAAYRGHAGVVERLLKGGAEVDQRVEKGSTPLHLAAYKGHQQVVSLLISYGADVNARNEEGITPLDWARSNSHVEVESVLLARGAVEGNPLPVKSHSRQVGTAAPVTESPGRYLLSQSGQYRERPLRKTPSKAVVEDVIVEDDIVERPIRQEELDRLESVSQINEIMVKHRNKQVLQTPDTQESASVVVAETIPEESDVQAGGAYRVQLAAVSDSERAQVLRSDYAERYRDILGQGSLVVEPVVAGERKLYRIRSSALSQSTVTAVCDQLKSRNQDCIVVKP